MLLICRVSDESVYSHLSIFLIKKSTIKWIPIRRNVNLYTFNLLRITNKSGNTKGMYSYGVFFIVHACTSQNDVANC